MISIHRSSIKYPIKGIHFWLEVDRWGWESEEDGDGHCLTQACSQELLGGNGKGSSRERSLPRILRTETSSCPPAFMATSSQRSLNCALVEPARWVGVPANLLHICLLRAPTQICVIFSSEFTCVLS